MKITVKDKEGTNFSIALPTGITLRLLLRSGKKYVDCGSAKALRDIIKAAKAAKAAKKQWGHLKIVEIHTSDGEEVEITL